MVGHGIISGRRFSYKGGRVQDYIRSVEVQYDRPLLWDGPMLADPKGHALFVPPHSVVHDLKVLGWLYNEDGVWLTTNTTLQNAFVRTNDDSIRFAAGVFDGFPAPGCHGCPAPVRGMPAWGIRVENAVVHQLFSTYFR